MGRTFEYIAGVPVSKPLNPEPARFNSVPPEEWTRKDYIEAVQARDLCSKISEQCAGVYEVRINLDGALKETAETYKTRAEQAEARIVVLSEKINAYNVRMRSKEITVDK